MRFRSAVVFLQNAWSPLYAGGTWPRESWLRALHACRSGQRLKHLAAAFRGGEVWYDNTTPLVGGNPSAVMPPIHAHMQAVLWARTPDVVVACGSQAAAACRELKIKPLLVVPHPAYRVLTNDLYERAGRLLLAGFDGEVVMRQARGRVVTQRYPEAA